MNPISQSDFRPRRLPVQWIDSPAFGPVPISRREAPVKPSQNGEIVFELEAWEASRRDANGIRPKRSRSSLSNGWFRFNRNLRAFTLLELMLVIAIIGFIAAVALPHVGGIGKANSMTAATRQLLDDVALARQRAMVSRSTIYMVFLPPMFWTNSSYTHAPAPLFGQQVSNLVTHQYSGYALISLASVGDQPGQHHPRYVTDWRFLPDGVFVAPFEFSLTNNTPTNLYTTNTLSGTILANVVYPWTWVNVPFPSLYPPNTTMSMPCIGFTPQGSLTTPFTNQYIALARGSILYPTDTNGTPVLEAPLLAENPAGNDVNNPNLIQIDWMTARATLVQNQLQ
jgi:prepilin-type N-terminal cleavage/methylation domain-containing protein